MLKSELLQLIANGENSGVEFKRDDVRPEQLAKEIVALANLRGGNVLLGVEDDGAVSGIQRPDLELWIMDTVFGRYVHPQVLPFYEEVELDGGKRVAVISITQGTTKPYVLRHNDREEIYVRVGSTSRRATREQQARLFESGGLLRAEVLPVSGTGLADLDRNRLQDYLVNITGDEAIPAIDAELERRLVGLGFMTERNGQRAVCTMAGMLLFGHTPRHALRQAGLRWMSFSGTDRDYAAQDDTVLDAPLVGLFETGASGQRRLLAAGLLEQVLERMEPFIGHELPELSGSVRRGRTWHYAPEVVREAMVNALVHRDWTRSGEVEVVNYADRLEVMNPGALHNSMTLEKMLAGQRAPRNPVLVDVLRDYGYVDARGMGVRRKIVPLTEQLAGRPPRFDLTDDEVRVVIPRSTQLEP